MYTLTENQPLRHLNTFGIASVARRYVEYDNVEDLRAYFANYGTENWAVLGGGSNILFRGDYAGTLLHPVSRGIELISEAGSAIRVRAAAGVEWDDFVAWAVEQGYGGVENLSYIPGYVGAAPVQNIGAYGVEAKETIREVEVFRPATGEVVAYDRAACRFGYRDSIFKSQLRGEAIILSVVFELTTRPQFCLGYGDLRARVEATGEATLQAVRDAVIAIRREKLPEPEELGNAGSFFKNPVVPSGTGRELQKKYPDMPLYETPSGEAKLAAGWLIDRAGWRGTRRGRVGVHERQALVLVNYGGATGSEVLDLATEIQQDVEQKFGVRIDMEVNVL